MISDIDVHADAISGVKRWCNRSIAKSEAIVEDCLNSFHPEQIVLIDNESKSDEKSGLINKIREQAKKRDISIIAIKTNDKNGRAKYSVEYI